MAIKKIQIAYKLFNFIIKKMYILFFIKCLCCNKQSETNNYNFVCVLFFKYKNKVGVGNNKGKLFF